MSDVFGYDHEISAYEKMYNFLKRSALGHFDVSEVVVPKAFFHELAVELKLDETKEFLFQGPIRSCLIKKDN